MLSIKSQNYLMRLQNTNLLKSILLKSKSNEGTLKILGYQTND